MLFSRFVLVLIFLLFSLPVFSQNHRVVRLTEPGVINPGEVSIAINPTNPDNIIGVSFQYGRPGQMRVSNCRYVTNDGGKTWTTVIAQNPRGLSQGDDSIAMNAAGVAFHTFMSFDGIRVQRPTRAYSGIFVSASRDSGKTWEEPVPVIDHVNSVTPFEDKPYIVTDNVTGSPFKNNLYLAWTRFDVYGSKNPAHRSHILFARSIDEGKTFAMPFEISDATGDCEDSDNTVEGAMVAAGLKGEVFVVWSGAKGLYFDKSVDGGLTFGKDKIIAETPGGWDFAVPGLDRANGMPVTKVDSSNSPQRGTIYVNWVDARNGDHDVFLMSSRDGGNNWTAPVRVNNDKVKNGKEQFFTWMAIDPIDGSVNIVFYDRRDLDGTKTGLTLARSVDGGKTFTNHKINLAPFECNDSVFFGDYSGIDAYNGRVVPIFMHFINNKELAVSAAIFDFNLNSQQNALAK